MTDRVQCAFIVTSLSLHLRNSNHTPLWAGLTMSATCRGTTRSSQKAPGFRVNSITRSFAASKGRPRANSNWSGFSGGADPHPMTFFLSGPMYCDRFSVKSNWLFVQMSRVTYRNVCGGGHGSSSISSFIACQKIENMLLCLNHGN